jgi:hypothetical protein
MNEKMERVLKIESFTSIHTKAATNLMFTHNWMTEQINKICKPYDLSTPKYNILLILSVQQNKAVSLTYIQGRMM